MPHIPTNQSATESYKSRGFLLWLALQFFNGGTSRSCNRSHSGGGRRSELLTVLAASGVAVTYDLEVTRRSHALILRRGV